jgi:hypothetical protein
MIRFFLCSILIPGVLGLAVLAAIVLPGDGDDLTLTRLLVGCGAMVVIQVSGGVVVGWLFGRHPSWRL